MPIKINVTRKNSVEASTLEIQCHVRDELIATLRNTEGTVIHSQDGGYVPRFFPDNNGGDDVILVIDIETGKILNWNVPTAEQLEEWINPEE